MNHSGTITFDEFVAGLIKYQWDTSKVRTQSWDWEIPYDELKFVRELGSGTHGTVYLSKWRGLDVAVKKLTGINKERVLEEFKNEIGILGKLRHPNILLFMGACTDQEHMVIVTEYLEGGNLYDLMKKVSFDLKMSVKLSKQIAFGLNYLHLRGIIHRDLKAENLLVDRYFNVKLCDFGLSCIKPTGGLKRRTGSPVCVAPEMWMGNSYDEKVDVYSYSITVWEILTGIEVLEDPGFRHIEDEATLKDAVVNKRVRPQIPDATPMDFANLIRICWDEDPKKRPNFATIITILDRISESV
jgi:serine/threonine protein kinase